MAGRAWQAARCPRWPARRSTGGGWAPTAPQPPLMAGPWAWGPASASAAAALGPSLPRPEGHRRASAGRGPLGSRRRERPWPEGCGSCRPHPAPRGPGPWKIGTSPVLSLFSFQIIGISLSQFNIWMFLFKRSGKDLLLRGLVFLSPVPQSACPSRRRRPLAFPG